MPPTHPAPNRALWLFLGLLIVLSAVFDTLIIRTGHLGSGQGLYVVGLMWSPGVAALLTCRLTGRSLASLGWRWGRTRYQLWSYLLPVLYSLLAYGLVWLAGWGGFYNLAFVRGLANSFGWEQLPPGLTLVLAFVVIGVLGLPRSAAYALGEEIGWRGFLAPELTRRVGYTKACWLVGGLWALWHYPILIFADYNSGTPAWYGLSCFTVMVVSLSFIFTWFRLKSGSLWTATLLHASHNLFIQGLFTPLTTDTGPTPYFIDEFGAVLPVVCAGVALYCWYRRPEVTVPYATEYQASPPTAPAARLIGQ